MAQLSVGDTAPDFVLTDSFGDTVRLSDFAGEKVVLYFYPAALTPGCTTQAIEFTEHLDQFKQAGYHIVGISPDEVERLVTFREKQNLRVTLLADPSKDTIQAYGAWGTRMIYGKEVVGVLRSTFVIAVDESGHGTIEQAQYSIRAKGSVDRLRRQLGLLSA